MSRNFSTGDSGRPVSFTMRDLVAVGFRRKRFMVLCFCGLFIGVLVTAMLMPTRYRAETKLLVKKGRLDPVVSPQQTAPILFRDTVSEEELNSEVELIVSEDVLRKVVQDCGLEKRKSLLSWLDSWRSENVRMAKTIKRLRSDLVVALVKKTNLISVAYESDSAETAARVLNALNNEYLQKHLEVHHPAGEAQFFEKETEQYRKALEETEEQLKEFSGEKNGVSPAEMRDLTLQKLNDFNGTLATTRSEIAGTEKRIQDLEAQQHSTPSRLTTQMKKGDNPQVLETLKNTLMTLELKRTELLTKYQPTYPLVTEVDKEIADTRDALAKEETTPVSEETTDQNPTYQWINEELAKAKADLSASQARERATETIVSLYDTNAKAFDQKGLLQQDLLRAQKANEDSYLLYLKKGEEARIADALDQTRIINVAITQAPFVPALPSRSPWTLGLVGVLLASVVTVGLVFTIEYVDQSFHTPSQVSAELGIPVLAAVPYHSHNNGFNGRNGSHPNNGNGAKSALQEAPVETESREDLSSGH
ncbi:MAG TPA: hypothetical protein VEF05_07190 [Terriglobales bacterium]|nr:hypothetical protein [Terriglobales bacterium]